MGYYYKIFLWAMRLLTAYSLIAKDNQKILHWVQTYKHDQFITCSVVKIKFLLDQNQRPHPNTTTTLFTCDGPQQSIEVDGQRGILLNATSI